VLLWSCVVVVDGAREERQRQSELEWGAGRKMSSLLRRCELIRMGGTVHVVPVGTCGHGRNDRRGSNFGPMTTGGDGATACPGAHARNVLARWGGPQARLSVRLVRSCGPGPANFFPNIHSSTYHSNFENTKPNLLDVQIFPNLAWW
jgi:hypothetical protein